MRDPKSKFFIDFKGKKSPIFDTIEGQFIYEEPNKVISKNNYKVKDLKVESNVVLKEPVDY